MGMNFLFNLYLFILILLIYAPQSNPKKILSSPCTKEMNDVMLFGVCLSPVQVRMCKCAHVRGVRVEESSASTTTTQICVEK